MRVSQKILHVILALIILSTAYSAIYAQEIYVIQKAMLIVYRDGVVHVNMEISVNETEPLIVVPLLSPSNTLDNIFVTDENGDPLDYDLNVENITIYSLGSTKITLEYDTIGLTFKEFELWTLKIDTPFNLIVIFPEDVNITYISDIPSAISVEGNRVKMELYPGEWEISYEIPIESPSKPPAQQPSKWLPPIEYIVVAGAITICAVLTYAYIRKRRIRSLRDEEIEVLRFIRERGGRALEAELRERFPQIPRTSMWRLIKRLEKQGIIRVKKVGLQNVVELK
ncbi:MAG: hypothetical protein QXX94_03025 [Candidatus Bathyarchaeia archaeon]